PILPHEVEIRLTVEPAARMENSRIPERAISGPQTELESASPSAQTKESEEVPLTQFSPQRPKGFRWPLTVISLLSTTFLFATNTTMVADIQPTIIHDFGEVVKLPWIAVAYELAALSVCLIWGKLYGQFNTKYIFIACVVIFEVGNAICGASQNMNMLIIGRAISGIGGSGTYIGTVNIITSLLAPAERPLYMSFVGAVWCIGTVVGPIIGGAFADGATWRWGFYINLCIAAVCAPVYIFVLPSQSKGGPGVSVMSRIRTIDWVGIVLFVGAACSIIMGTSFGGALHAWKSGQIIGLFVCSGILWILFWTQQALCLFTTPEFRFFPIKYLKSLEMIILFVQIAAGSACTLVPVFFIPLYFQFVQGDSALDSGVRLLPFIGVLVVGLLVNGGLMGVFRIYSPWFTVGGIIVVIGSALLHTVNLNTDRARIYGYTAILGFGTGLFVQAPFAIAQAKVQASELQDASSFITAGQISGIAFSLSISNSIFLNLSTKNIAALLPNIPLNEIQSLLAGVGASFLDDLSPTQRAAVLGILVHDISRMYIMLITTGVLITILSVFMKREGLNSDVKDEGVVEA
ncbi:Efflux pump, partial [Lachnellula occidentalis]